MSTIESIEPISLTGMVEQAELLTRVDRKYLIPADRIELLLDALGAGARVLDIDGERRLRYESVYFDTPELLSYHMAAHPRRRRFKLRTRSYLDTGTAYLEIKTRGARGTTVKERSEYEVDARAGLTPQARIEVADAFDTIGVAPQRAWELRATLVTRYRRATLLQPGGGARATIDTELSWIEPDGTGFLLPGRAIVETKSGGQASPLDRALWRAGHRPVAVSKYATGMAALHRELPANRWARLLRGPFAPESRAPIVPAAGPRGEAATALRTASPHPTEPSPTPEETACFAVSGVRPASSRR